MELAKNYLETVKKQFQNYKSLGERSMDQLEASQLFYTINENTNSISVIVKHMHGNMLSRWTDFLIGEGEKTWRKREDEFEEENMENAMVLIMWKEGWDCLFKALNSLQSDQLTEIVIIRGEKHSVMEAINRQLAHYSYHVGQIVFAAKQLKGSEWESLSIPRHKHWPFYLM